MNHMSKNLNDRLRNMEAQAEELKKLDAEAVEEARRRLGEDQIRRERVEREKRFIEVRDHDNFSQDPRFDSALDRLLDQNGL